MAGGFDLNIGNFGLHPLPLTKNPTLVPIGIKFGIMCVPVSCDSEDFQYFIKQSNAFIMQYEQTFFLGGDFSLVIETKSSTTPLTTGPIIMHDHCLPHFPSTCHIIWYHSRRRQSLELYTLYMVSSSLL